MFSKKPKSQGASAAWRIAIWPTAAFAVGSAVAFVIMYLLIARDIQKRSDAWLSGEAETLTDVSANTTRDALYDRLVGEVAELASREVADADESRTANIPLRSSSCRPRRAKSIRSGSGPVRRNRLLPRFSERNWFRECPASVQVEGWKKAFRVVYKKGGDGGESVPGICRRQRRAHARPPDRALPVWCGPSP